MDGQRSRKSWLRRIVRAGFFLLVLGGITVVSLPWLLSTAPARRLMVSTINKSLKPSRIEVKGISLSWTGSIRLTGLSLRDGQGKTLITARQAVLNRGLLALARNHAKLGTLTIDGAVVDVERRADGSIDLVDALDPPVVSTESTPKPEDVQPAAASTPIDLMVRVTRSSISFRTPELAEPFAAEQADVEVRIPASSADKLTARVRLAKPPKGPDDATLGLDAEYDHHAPANPDMNVAIHARTWPLALDTAGVVAHARLDGVVNAACVEGKWTSTGDARLLDLEANGATLAGDRLAFDAATGRWDLGQSASGWNVRKLDLKSPVATLTATGEVATSGNAVAPDATLEAQIDLAALAQQIPHTLHLREGLTLERGSAHLAASVKTEGKTQRALIEARVSDVAARDASHAFTLQQPATITLQGSRSADALQLETLAAKTGFLDVKGSGDLTQGIKITGTIDLAQVVAQLQDLIDFGGVSLAGKGALVADYRKKDSGFVGRFATELRGVKIVGVTTEPIVRGSLRIDAAASGPADASGAPTTWEDLRVNVTSPQDKLILAARSKNNVLGVGAVAEIPTKVGDHDAQASARLMIRWQKGAGDKQGTIEVDELRLGLKPLDPKVATPPIALAAKGRVNLDTEEISLVPLPIPDGSIAPLAVAPEGVTIHGLTRTPAADRVVRAVFLGDVAAIDQVQAAWSGSEPHGLAGKLTGFVTVAPDRSGRLTLNAGAQVLDLSRPSSSGKARQSEGAVALAFKGVYDAKSDALTCEDARLISRYAQLGAKGQLDELTGKRIADLSGTLAPNWGTLTLLAAEMVEPKMQLAGGARPWHVKGPLSGASLATMLRGLDAEVGLDLDSANAFGLALGKAPIVFRCKDGNLTLDPIQTTLNNGTVDLRPIPVVDDAQGILLLLAQGSKIDSAEINDEVSHRVLRYVAPVLDDATEVTGRVSLTVARAEIPISCPPSKTLTMTGELVFQDVMCSPGPFADQVLTLVGKTDQKGLRIKQPVQLEIANSRVIQKGLEIPIRKDAKLALEGSVGFDQTLDMKAVVPINGNMFGGRSDVAKAIGDTRITVPIGGTVKQPRINRQALQVALRQLTQGAMKRELSEKATGLLKDLGLPADAAPAPNGAGNAGGANRSDLKNLQQDLLRRVLPGGVRGR